MTDKIDYTKKPLTIAEQIARLKQRGLIFDDESEATSYLFNISYYRLRAYTYPFQENGEDCDHNFTRKDIHGSPDKPGGLSIQPCKSEKKEFYIRYSS